MLSIFLKTYQVVSGVSIETIIQDFYSIHPKGSVVGIQKLLESHGHIIVGDIIVMSNNDKMEEFLCSGYDFESLGKLAHDYRNWRNFIIKVKLDMDKTIQVLDKVLPNWRMKQSSSLGVFGQDMHP